MQKKLFIKIRANNNLPRKLLYFSLVLGRNRPPIPPVPAPDAYGLKLEPTGSRVLLVNVSEYIFILNKFSNIAYLFEFWSLLEGGGRVPSDLAFNYVQFEVQSYSKSN